MAGKQRLVIRTVANPSAQSRVVIMSGAPGSGKSSLARLLAERLRFMHIERDTILETYWQQNKNDNSYVKADGIPRFFQLVQFLISDGQDLVIDGTLYAGKSDLDMPKVCKDAKAVNIHTFADNTIERFKQREASRNNGQLPKWVEPHVPVLEKNYDLTAHALDMMMPVLEVDTNDGYKPNIDEIVEWLFGQYGSL